MEAEQQKQGNDINQHPMQDFILRAVAIKYSELEPAVFSLSSEAISQGGGGK